jgi:hypothetical protein
MSKIFHVHAPHTMKLHSMSGRDVEKLVESEATKALAAFPQAARPVGVNSVRVSQANGGWAEWTRACCGSRNQIDDYTDPVRGEWEGITNAIGAPSPFEHVESSFKVQDLSNPAMHGGGAGRGVP